MYGIIDFKVPLPPPYQREVWDYKNANSNYNVNKKIDILNECLKNIFHNFIPYRVIKCNYRHPPWMTDDVKTKLKERSKFTKKYYKYGNMKSNLDKVIAKSI